MENARKVSKRIQRIRRRYLSVNGEYGKLFAVNKIVFEYAESIKRIWRIRGKNYAHAESILGRTPRGNSSLSYVRVHMLQSDEDNGKGRYTAKTQYRKFETNIPRKGIARPQSQFPHSCVCVRFIYSHNQSAFYAAEKYVD